MEITSAEKGKAVVIYRIGVNEYDPLPGPKPKRPAYLDEGKESDADDEDYEPESDYNLFDSNDESSCKYANESMRTSFWAGLRKPSEFVPYAHVPKTGDSESDQASCDELHEVKGSDDEEDQVEVKRYREFNPKKEMHNPTFEVTQRFGDKWILLKAIRIHALVERRGTNFKNNDTKVVHARRVEGCNWEVYGARVSKEDPTFEIITLNDKRTCDKIWEKNRNYNSNIVSDWYLVDFAHDPRMSVGILQFRVLNEKKITISRTQAYKAKIKALEKVRGNIVGQFAKLKGYMEETKKLNPSTTFELMKDPNPERPNTFKSLLGKEIPTILSRHNKKGGVGHQQHTQNKELTSTLRPSSSANPAAPFIVQNHDMAEQNNTDVASTLHPSSYADPATPFIVQNHDVAEPNKTDDSLSSNQQQHQNMDQLEQDSNQTPSADERSPEPEATITNVTLSGNLGDHEADVVIFPTTVTSPAANKAIKNCKKSAPSTPKRTSARLAAVKVRFDADGHGSSLEKAIQILGEEAVETSVGRKRAKTFHGANPRKSTLFTHCI
ncbi:OLC1v1008238C1 [Oldenlandia corymbosa var. corymbosa]|uniref:OLC1v1008238C1 n=1 Tax=Oldenlandia corymbosa var. corymbosa TaxID=529605 RepID=A0AAV1DLG4_OLDCO|nr:OLC1v1008238C1 [Oldenlandia corymbosa var. corymbosa]